MSSFNCSIPKGEYSNLLHFILRPFLFFLGDSYKFKSDKIKIHEINLKILNILLRMKKLLVLK
jgi:hypothetical protein